MKIGHFGVIFWGDFVPFFGRSRGSFWGHLGIVLASFWHHSGVALDVVLAHFEAFIGPFFGQL